MTRRRPQAIELTSKKWKLQLVLSMLLVLVGCGLFFGIGTSSEGNQHTPLSPILVVVGAGTACLGLVWHLVVRFLVWWNHG